MAINFSMVVRKSGPIFSNAAKGLVEAEVEAGIAGAQGALVRAEQAATPVRKGDLRASVVARGVGLSRTVAIGLWRAIPLEAGWLPGNSRARIAFVRATYKLKGKRKLLRALKAGKVPGKKFFYSTFDLLQPQLMSQFLAPIGVGIVGVLGG